MDVAWYLGRIARSASRWPAAGSCCCSCCRRSFGVCRTLAKIGVSRSTFYRQYDLYRRFAEAGLKDRRAAPKRPAWNRITDHVRTEIIEMPPEWPELSPREVGDLNDLPADADRSAGSAPRGRAAQARP